MAEAFQQQGFFSASEFLAATQQIPQDQYPWLPDDIPHLEGFLFPDTYQLPMDQITAPAVVDVMLDRFETVALPIYQETPEPNLSLLEWVTLASIVEKESVVPDERNLIAGVFTNRLVRGMPLGADPTVEYGLGIRQTKDQPLTWTQVETPFFPYTFTLNRVLPPHSHWLAMGSLALGAFTSGSPGRQQDYLLNFPGSGPAYFDFGHHVFRAVFTSGRT